MTCRPTSRSRTCPGPRQPLYFAGAQLDNYIPVSTIADGMGLNITVHSYMDQLDFGLIADRELVPDLWDMVDMHIDEIARLFEATGAEWVEPQRAPAMRRGGNSVKPVPRRAAAKAASEEDGGKEGPGKKSAAKKAPAKKRAKPEEDPGQEDPGQEDSSQEDPAKKTAAKKTMRRRS